MDIPNLINNFISDEEAKIIVDFLDKTAVQSPVEDNHRCTLGFPNYESASKVSMDNPVMSLTDNPEDNKAILLITEVYDRVRKTLEEFYNEDLILIHSSYTEMSPGPGMGLHSDTHWLDGSLRQDGISAVMEHSAVLYLATAGEDFTGGGLYFPLQEYRYMPKKSDLSFFTGDLNHIHIVEDVTSGLRKSISIFFGFKDVVLELLSPVAQ